MIHILCDFITVQWLNLFKDTAKLPTYVSQSPHWPCNLDLHYHTSTDCPQYINIYQYNLSQASLLMYTVYQSLTLGKYQVISRVLCPPLASFRGRTTQLNSGRLSQALLVFLPDQYGRCTDRFAIDTDRLLITKSVNGWCLSTWR